MLVNFQQKIKDIFITIGHSFLSFDFIVYSFRDSRGYPLLEVIQDEMPFAEKLHRKFPEGKNV